MVRQAVPDLLRCSGACAQGVVVAGDFLRVATAGRHGKSPTAVGRAANRRGLLCSIMAKVQLRNCPKTSIGSNLEPQKSTKEGEEALFRCSEGPKWRLQRLL